MNFTKKYIKTEEENADIYHCVISDPAVKVPKAELAILHGLSEH